MTLEPGYRVGVVPRFHVAEGWAARLAVNGGCERTAAGFAPRADWRPPSDGELSLLTGAGPPADTFGLFNVPGHLLATWAKAAERLGDPGGAEAYQGFVRELAGFLRFKGLPLPPACACDLVVTAPGQRSVRGGLASSVTGPEAGIFGVVNLGDEPTAVVFLNLPPAAMRAKLATPGGGSLADDFLTRFEDYPLAKVRLDRGEGCWLPAGGAVFDGWTADQTDPGAWLVVKVCS